MRPEVDVLFCIRITMFVCLSKHVNSKIVILQSSYVYAKILSVKFNLDSKILMILVRTTSVTKTF